MQANGMVGNILIFFILLTEQILIIIRQNFDLWLSDCIQWVVNLNCSIKSIKVKCSRLFSQSMPISSKLPHINYMLYPHYNGIWRYYYFSYHLWIPIDSKKCSTPSSLDNHSGTNIDASSGEELMISNNTILAHCNQKILYVTKLKIQKRCMNFGVKCCLLHHAKKVLLINILRRISNLLTASERKYILDISDLIGRYSLPLSNNNKHSRATAPVIPWHA